MDAESRSIESQDYAALHGAVRKLARQVNRLTANASINGFQFLDVDMSSEMKLFRRVLDVINVIRNKDTLIGILFDHDTGGAALTGIQSVITLLDESENFLPLIFQMNNKINLLMRVVESMEAHVEGKNVRAQSIDVGEYFKAMDPILFDLFCRGRSRESASFRPRIDDEALNATMRAHRGILGRLMLNMAVNADKRGHARILAEDVFIDRNRVVIEIVDDGTGIEKNTPSGLGLGLAGATEKLKRFGGTFHADPHGGIDGGARFIITTPQIKKAKPRNVHAAAQSATPI